MKQEYWLIVDTETNGLHAPIYTVEIAAQRMCGWEPVDEPFCRLLHQDVPIDPVAELVHGYSREYLAAHGMRPRQAHREFHEYAGGLPIVAYNLSSDWDRVLLPEYHRLDVPITGVRGFCAMTLARRVIAETSNLRLDTLRRHFQLAGGPAHKALNDVQTVVRLFQTVFRPRLESAGLVGFETLAAFSRRTPVARCLAEILQVLPGGLERVAPRPRRRRTTRRSYHTEVPRIKACIEEVVSLCRGLLADHPFNEARLDALRSRLAESPYPYIYPMNVLAEKLQAAATDAGRSELALALQEAVAAFTPAYEATS